MKPAQPPSPTNAAHEDADVLLRHVSRLGFDAPEMDDVELFHETTKLYPYHLRTIGRRIAQYMHHPRAVQETAANCKVYAQAERIALPAIHPPEQSLARVLRARRSHRVFAGTPLRSNELAALLSAVASNRVASSQVVPQAQLRFRPFPSGGGLYPTELYLALLNVESTAPGFAHYDPREHALELLRLIESVQEIARALGEEGELTRRIGAAALISVVAERSVVKYGRRGYRFALLEAGMLAYTLDLAATALGLGTLHWGGFFDAAVDSLLELDGVSESVVTCLLIGRPEGE